MTDAYCRCCKGKRAKEHKPPRKLVALAPEILVKPGKDGEQMFQNLATPIFVCEECDGDVSRLSENWELKDEDF